MGLLQNGRLEAQYPVRLNGGILTGEQMMFGQKLEKNLNKYIGEASLAQFNSKPVGYNPNTTWSPNKKSGGLGLYNGALGSGSVSSANLAGGRNAEATLAGSGEISNAAMGLILNAVATLAGTGSLNANIAGKLEAVATLSGSGDINAALGALAGLTATLVGSGTVASSSTLTGKGNMSADITPFTDLSPQNLAAAVWNALAASFEESGTMGQKLNAAGTAGDPWTASVPGAYAPGTAGYTLGEYIDAKISSIAAGSGMTVAQFLALK
jgi:hypothetical protein